MPSYARLLPIFLTLLALSLGASKPLRAQELNVSYVDWPGLFEKTTNGEYTGFYPELARAIADRAGFSLRFIEFDTPREAIGIWTGGRNLFAAGPPRTPALAHAVFSEPVGEIATYLFVLEREDPGLSLSDMTGQRIGVVERAAGSDLGDLGGRAGEVVSFVDIRDAFGALIMGRIDGVVTTYKFAADLLRNTQLDYRVRTVDPALRVEPFYALLSPDRADLMPRVNDAIRELRADGTLDRLLAAWNVTKPDPVPSVLTVGVSRFPPYQVVREDGTFTGYGVEALRQLATRAGLDLRFIELTSDEWAAGPADGTYDMLPPLSVTEAKRRQMDFTRPLQESPYSIFLRRSDDREIGGMEDLAGMRVGFTRNSWARSLVGSAPQFDEIVVEDENALLDVLLTGDVDAVIYASSTLHTVAEARGQMDDLQIVDPPVAVSQRAIGLRPGLATVRERLDAVIPGYLASEPYQMLRERWLNPQPFWTPDRVRQAWIAALGLLVLAVVVTFLVVLGARRKAVQRATELESLSNRLGAILNTARSGILGFGRNGDILVANLGAREILAERGRQLPFRWPEGISFVDPDRLAPLDAARDPINRALAGAALNGEVSILRQGARNGKLRYISVSSSSVAAPSPGDIATVVILDDVTQHERNRQSAERSARLEALGQMTGGIAHDFNNLLATVEYAATLLGNAPPEKAKTYLDSIRKTVSRGADLTRRLLTFSKQNTGIAKSASVREVMEDFQRLSGMTVEPGIKLEYDIRDQDLRVFCDIAQLENALLNLVINSRDAIIVSGEGDRIVVSVRGLSEEHIQAKRQEIGEEAIPENLSPRFIDFSVSDNGPGMTEEVRRRATDPFFTTKGMSAGTGLGLSMVYGFVESAGGELRIYSEVGHGTTVRLMLPRGTETGGREDAQDRPERSRGHGQKILIVEDEAELLNLVSAVVQDLGYSIGTAVSGEEALARLQAGESYDLLLTDIVMPGGIGGFDLAREARQLHPTMPIVYMSGYTGVRAADMGSVVAPILQKPCPPSELAQALKDAFRGA